MNKKPIVELTQADLTLPDQIFYKFDSLLPGNGFIIHEDIDPHSIYSQMREEKGDTFSWEYLAAGPKKWCVKISKREDDSLKETLGEIAVSDYRKALILRKHGLDFSFKGKRTLKEACAEKDVSAKTMERELNACSRQSLVYTVNYNSLELDYLADFIITNHHQYTTKILLSIAGELEKNATLISRSYSYLFPLIETFKQLSITMKTIMQLEEQGLFPYIRFLAQATRGKIGASILPSGSVQDHISKIEAEHSKIGEQINYLCNFTAHYPKPPIEHSFYTQVPRWLHEFNNDLHQHVHVEANILFRKALMLEQEYLANVKTSINNPAINISPHNDFSSLL